MSTSQETATGVPTTDPTTVESSESLINVKFVVKEVALPYDELDSMPEMIQVLIDAVVGLRDAWQNHRVLHKDIRPANLLSHNGRGLLLDWEYTRKKLAMPSGGGVDQVRDMITQLQQQMILQQSSTSPVKDGDGTLADDELSTQMASVDAAGSGSSL